MDSLGWWVVPSSLNLMAFQREGIWLNSTAFAPLYKLLVRQVGQLDRPDPEVTQYH